MHFMAPFRRVVPVMTLIKLKERRNAGGFTPKILRKIRKSFGFKILQQNLEF